ncbi:hypothetical protein ACNI3Q_07010 [Sphingomonas sp. FW199]|uniref:hypothetical protein n=1 Tax=Sphingomonas sp. FW199 TaxID=3400217 RepID=UPI003CEDCEDB
MSESWASVTKAWTEKVPGHVILGVIIAFALLIALFLLTTPPCESRSFVAITNDRTKRAECSHKPDTAPSEEVAPANANPQPSNPLPATTGQPTITSVLNPDISFDPSGREDFRKRYGLTAVEAESASLEETPSGSFGFAYGGSFATVWKDKLDTLTIRSISRSVYFEIQKRPDGKVYIVGFMRGDSAREIQSSRTYPEKIRLYSERYKKNDAVIAIPLNQVKTVGQSEIDVNRDKYIPVLDLGFE